METNQIDLSDSAKNLTIKSMLTKILFTIAVIIVVLFVYQARFKATIQPNKRVKTPEPSSFKPSKWVIYSIAGVLAVASGVVYFFKWQADNTVINIRVVSTQEEQATTYKARQKDIKGRTFTTLDGRLVTLGDADRIELLKD